MYFWLHWVFVAASRLLSSCGEQRQHPNCGVWSSHCNGSSCCRACAPGHADFSSCESQALDRGLGNRGAWLSCFEASGISLGQNGTYVPCIGRWIFFFFNHWTTREVPFYYFCCFCKLNFSPFYFQIVHSECNRNTIDFCIFTLKPCWTHVLVFCLYVCCFKLLRIF